MSEPWSDIPLFREIQRILASSSGPVNKELATQVGTALATQDGDSAPDPIRARVVAEAVRDSELVVAGYARLDVEEPAAVRSVDRAEWARSTLDAWGWIFEHLVRKLTAGAPGEDEQTPAGLAAAVAQVAPLLMGIQVGTLVGQLARDAIGRYDYPIPRDDDGRLFFVDPNVARVASDYDFDVEAFLRWLAVGSTARHLVVQNARWIDRYWRSLLVEVVDAMEIDVAELQTRMIDLQAHGPEGTDDPTLGGAKALQEGLGAGLPLVPTDRHRRALARLRSFVAIHEGYARHVTSAVGASLVGPAKQLEEGFTRHRLAGNEGEAMLDAILGVSFDRELEAAGATFCAAVVQLRGMGELNAVWAAPDNLPTYDEIKDPFAWIERVVDAP